MFLKKIVVDEKNIVIHSDDAFAPVGYLTFSKMHLEDKGMDPSATLSQRMLNLIYKYQNYSKQACLNIFLKITSRKTIQVLLT